MSGEALQRQESSDSSAGSSSRTESLSGTQQAAAEEVESRVSTADTGRAFRLPWEGDPFWQVRPQRPVSQCSLDGFKVDEY